ncbi:MAG: glycosyltransferase family 4 protein [Chloroflexota bacterium]
MMAGLRVLQVSKSTGGVGQYLRWLVHGLDKERFEVTAVCLSEGGEKLADELSRVDGVRALSLEMERYRINPLTDARVWWKLRRLIRQGGFDLIHAHTSKPGFLARTAAIGSGVPAIYRPAGFAFHNGTSRWRAWLFAGVERFTARFLTRRIVTVCDEERELARRYRVGSDEQLVTIHTGIDLCRFDGDFDRGAVRRSLGVPEPAFLFGTVGRLSRQKAPADFIRAAAMVHSKYPEAHFAWVGDGELQAEAEALVRALGLQEVFHFAGLRMDIPAVLHAMDCFVLASHWEGFSLSVLEAMAARLPVVMSRVSGAAEAVSDGETGLIVPIGDAQALAGALAKIVSSTEYARELGQAGRHRLEQHFTQARMIANIQELYEQVYAASARKQDKRI